MSYTTLNIPPVESSSHDAAYQNQKIITQAIRFNPQNGPTVAPDHVAGPSDKEPFYEESPDILYGNQKVVDQTNKINMATHLPPTANAIRPVSSTDEYIEIIG